MQIETELIMWVDKYFHVLWWFSLWFILQYFKKSHYKMLVFILFISIWKEVIDLFIEWRTSDVYDTLFTILWFYAWVVNMFYIRKTINSYSEQMKDNDKNTLD